MQSRITTTGTRTRGFALLVAVIFTSVILSVGLALMDVAYKQVLLASTARQSQYAFYNADSALECGLEQDQAYDTFSYGGSVTSGTFSCEAHTVNWSLPLASGGTRTSGVAATFKVPCTGGGYNAEVTVYKQVVGATITTKLYANGFNNCKSTDPQRVERGLQSNY